MTLTAADAELIQETRDRAIAAGLETTIVCFEGTLGAGKTLFLSYFLQRLHRQDIPIYTNFMLKGSETLEHLLKLRTIGAAAIGIDDAVNRAGLDSRGFGSNKLSTRLLGFARKKRLIIGYTQQLETGVDKRLRRITNYIFNVEKVKFPVFRFVMYNPQGKPLLSSYIRFHPAVYQNYETDEEVFDIVYLDRLMELWDVAAATDSRGNLTGTNMFIYRALVESQLGLSKDLSKVTYECIKANNTAALALILEDNGYDLRETVAE